MNCKVGDTATRELTVTAEMVELYAQISGDRNPLHFDEAFASATSFGGLIAQGGITTGLLHALVAMDLPGPGSVFLRQQFRFRRPARVGDTLRATGTVTAVRERRAMVEMDFVVTNAEGETLLEGDAVLHQAAPSGMPSETPPSEGTP